MVQVNAQLLLVFSAIIVGVGLFFAVISIEAICK